MTSLQAQTPFPYCSALDTEEALAALARGVDGLTPAELVDTCGFLHKQGVRPASVRSVLRCRDYTHSHYLQISQGLCADAKALLHRRRLTIGHARALARLPSNRQAALAEKAARGLLSVRDIEAAVRGSDLRLSAEDAAYYQRLSDYMAERVGHPLTVAPDRDNSRAGTITVRYEDLEMFEAICARLRVNLDGFS